MNVDHLLLNLASRTNKLEIFTRPNAFADIIIEGNLVQGLSYRSTMNIVNHGKISEFLAALMVLDRSKILSDISSINQVIGKSSNREGLSEALNRRKNVLPLSFLNLYNSLHNDAITWDLILFRTEELELIENVNNLNISIPRNTHRQPINAATILSYCMMNSFVSKYLLIKYKDFLDLIGSDILGRLDLIHTSSSELNAKVINKIKKLSGNTNSDEISKNVYDYVANNMLFTYQESNNHYYISLLASHISQCLNWYSK